MQEEQEWYPLFPESNLHKSMCKRREDLQLNDDAKEVLDSPLIVFLSMN